MFHHFCKDFHRLPLCFVLGVFVCVGLLLVLFCFLVDAGEKPFACNSCFTCFAFANSES